MLAKSLLPKKIYIIHFSWGPSKVDKSESVHMCRSIVKALWPAGRRIRNVANKDDCKYTDFFCKCVCFGKWQKSFKGKTFNVNKSWICAAP